MEVNTKGRVIHRGPKGGFYVLDAKGKKVYKFTRAVPAPVRKSPSPARKSPIYKRPLMRILESVRKRRRVLYSPINTGGSSIEVRSFKKFTTIKPGEPLKSRKVTLYIQVPVETNDIKNGTTMAVTKEFLPTQEWIDAQTKYIESLNQYDYFTAMAHTVRSHQWIGPWLRGEDTYHLVNAYGHTRPLYPQLEKLASTSKEPWAVQFSFGTYAKIPIPRSVLAKALDMYAKDLYRIIRNAPPIPKTMYLFRGVQDDIFKGKIGTRHILDGFASASYVPLRAYTVGGGYMRIKLLKGARVLLMQGLNQWDVPGEYEILINKKSLYKITKRNLYRTVINSSPNRARTAWDQMKVTDVTVF